MKTNELMLGDWLACEGKYGKVKELREKKLSLRTENSVMIVYYDSVDPIPLTAEILEKNGFELYEQDFTSNKVYVFDKGFTYIEDCGNYFVIGANVEYEHFGRKLRFISSTIEVYYVHELQHALRLVGIEKEIIV